MVLVVLCIFLKPLVDKHLKDYKQINMTRASSESDPAGGREVV